MTSSIVRVLVGPKAQWDFSDVPSSLKSASLHLDTVSGMLSSTHTQTHTHNLCLEPEAFW